jgi:tRNA(Ile)-lysidine synthase
MTVSMVEKIKKAIREQGMLDMGDHVVAAVSGGPDSMALLKVLELISTEFHLTLIAAHLHHGIRGEDADEEEELVRQYSQAKNILFVSRRIHVPSLKRKKKQSVEDIGREERYRFLKEVAETYAAQKIALGHQLHDQAETMIMNFLRGSGLEGLRGMLPVREGLFIRPLLAIRREEILHFLQAQQVPYRLDPSNESNLYLRNRIRQGLIPDLKDQFNPDLEENLRDMADILRLEDDYMNMLALGILAEAGVQRPGGEMSLQRSNLRKHHPALQRRMIKSLLEGLSPSGKGIGFTHVMAVIRLSESDKPGGQVDLPHGIRVRREYDVLYFQKKTERDGALKSEKRSEEFLYDVSIPQVIPLHELGRNLSFELVKPSESLVRDDANRTYMDCEKIVFPLVVRTFRPGDRIQPLGMEGTKKLKAYFIDRKVPQRRRGEIPLLVDGKSVIWIAGMRLSERVKITDKSRKILKVEIV